MLQRLSLLFRFRIRSGMPSLGPLLAGRGVWQFAAAAAEPLCQGIVLFFLYRLVLEALGAAQLGIWSLVIASLSLSQIADPGIARAMPRSLAAIVSGTTDERRRLQALHVGNGAMLCALVYLVIGLVLWLPSWHLLGFSVAAADLALARALLPFAIGSMVLAGIAAVVLQSLIAARRADLKTGIVVAAELIQLLVAALAVARWGLWGMLAAQLARNAVLLLGGLAAAVVQFRIPVSAFLRPDRDVLRELLGFGLRLQSISVIAFLYEPATKFLLGRFGGLDIVAWFDMASRLIQQGRAVIVAGNYNAVPHLTEAALRPAQAGLVRMLRLQFLLTAGAGLCLCLTLGIGAPLISRLWIGDAQPEFVSILAILSVAWFINILSVPTFMLAISRKRTGVITIAHAVIAVLNLAFGYGLGYALGAIWVVLAWALALIVGSVIIALSDRTMLHAQG